MQIKFLLKHIICFRMYFRYRWLFPDIFTTYYNLYTTKIFFIFIIIENDNHNSKKEVLSF